MQENRTIVVYGRDLSRVKNNKQRQLEIIRKLGESEHTDINFLGCEYKLYAATLEGFTTNQNSNKSEFYRYDVVNHNIMFITYQVTKTVEYKL